MRTVRSGAGFDTTSTVQALLQSSTKILKKRLFLIGEESDPHAIFATDSSKSLEWDMYGVFNSAKIDAGDVTTEIGFSSTSSVDVTWTPKRTAFGSTVATANPLQLAQFGYYDNWRFRAWTAYLPLTNDGDANTYGASELFAGILGKTTVNRGQIGWSVKSLMALLDLQVPVNVIENANTQAAFTAGQQPLGETQGVPFFTVFTGSTAQVIYGDVEAPYTAGHVFNFTANAGAGALAYGYLIFIDSPGSTLGGFWSPIENNFKFIDGHAVAHNAFTLYNQLPWAPTPWSGTSGDQFFVSAKPPITQAEATAYGIPYYGFPFVPYPSSNTVI